MLGKLSIRNAKRQAKDYIIYFITVIISVALMFSFNSIATSKDISELSSYMKFFSKAIIGISVIITFVMAWLINYTMKFMLEKRSKEFGTYQILGIEKKSISNMFTLENIIIGIIAFIFGIFVGIFLYQIFTSIIMNLFNQIYKVEIVFNLKAVGLTAIYFFGIFLLVLLNCRRKIKKTKVYDLLYAEKKNENNIIKKSRGNIIVFITSIVLLICAIVLNNNEFSHPSTMVGQNIFIAIIMLILGIYLFYISISSFIIKRYLKNKTRKYKKNNMFLYRNLTSKINTMSITMGTIALMFTIILIGGNVALLFNNMLNNEIEMGYPFEIMISATDRDFSKYKEYIENNAEVTDMYEYRLYYIEKTKIKEALKGTPFEASVLDVEYVMTLKDYNKLREILGYENVTLADDEVIINSMKTATSAIKEYVRKDNEINILDKKMKIKEVRDEVLAQLGFNGYIYTIIVPDNMAEALRLEEERLINDENSPIYLWNYDYKLIAQTTELTDEKFRDDLANLIPVEEKQAIQEVDGEKFEYTKRIVYGDVITKGDRMAQSKSFYAIISFLAFYIALIFIMTTATMLAIQQLSDSEKYKYRYDLLRKLGMDELEINRTIFKQLFFYFVLPILLPMLISIPIILSVGKVFLVGVTIEEIFKNIGIVVGMLILVYGIYFIATDVQFNRNINGD